MENVARAGTVEQRADERNRRFSDVVIWRKRGKNSSIGPAEQKRLRAREWA